MVRWQAWSARPIWVWQHLQLSYQTVTGTINNQQTTKIAGWNVLCKGEAQGMVTPPPGCCSCPFLALLLIQRHSVPERLAGCRWCAHFSCLFVCLVCCLTPLSRASVFQGRICTDNFTCCHTEIEVADQTFYLTQSQYTDTGPTSPSADPITPGAWQGSHLSANFWVTGMTRPRKNPVASGIRTRDLPLSRRTPYH